MCNCNFVSIPFFFHHFSNALSISLSVDDCSGECLVFSRYIFFLPNFLFYPFYWCFMQPMATILANWFSGFISISMLSSSPATFKIIPAIFPQAKIQGKSHCRKSMSKPKETTKNFPFSWGKTFLLSLFSSIFKKKKNQERKVFRKN